MGSLHGRQQTLLPRERRARALAPAVGTLMRKHEPLGQQGPIELGLRASSMTEDEERQWERFLAAVERHSRSTARQADPVQRRPK